MCPLYVRIEVAQTEQAIAEGSVRDQEEVERRKAKWLDV